MGHWPEGCGSSHATRDDLASLEFSAAELLEQMERQGLAVGWVLMINGGGIDLDTMYCDKAPRITGAEHPLTAADPMRVLTWALEVSPFPDTAGRFGHVVGLGLDDPYFCPLDGFPAPLLDHVRGQVVAGRRALAGYAHVTWPVAPDRWPAWPFERCYGADEELPGFTPYPYLAPLDVVLGRVDFLEAATASWRPSPDGDSWTALYYGLLDGGFRPGLAGGSDNTYTGPEVGDCRTWVLVDGPLSGGAWLDGLAAGATSLSNGPGPLLTLAVDGVPLGGRVALEGPGEVAVRITLRRVGREVDPARVGRGDGGPSAVDTPIPGRLQLVRDGGAVVWDVAQPLPAAVAEEVSLEARLPLAGSTWLAARWVADEGPAAAHTAALPVELGGERLRRTDALQHWLAWCRELWDPDAGGGRLESMAPPHCAWRDRLWPDQLSRQLIPHVLAASRALERLLGSEDEPLDDASHPGIWCQPVGEPPVPLYDPRDPGCDDER